MIVALILSTLMSLVGLFEPLTRSRGIPLEWILLVAWGALGLALFRATARLRGRSPKA